jgi:hypothetical protein
MSASGDGEEESDERLGVFDACLISTVEEPCKISQKEEDIAKESSSSYSSSAGESSSESFSEEEEEEEFSVKKLRRTNHPRKDPTASATLSAGHLQCPHCPRKCSKPFRLEEHIRTHTGERPFECAKCYKGFLRKGHL